MKLSAQLKLLPTPDQAATLRRTLETANAACAFVSQQAWQAKTFKQFDLHHLCYRDVRARFGLSAQATVRVIAKVADSYKLDHTRQRTFRPHGGIAYDDRLLSWGMSASTVSIWTVSGRLHIPFVCGDHQRGLLPMLRGEVDLVMFRDKFFLAATCDVPEPPPQPVEGVLGVDLGVINLAVDSDGDAHSGGHVNSVRHRHRRLRQKLQAKGTRAARRKLRQLAGRERRFARDTNHRISKQLVAKAQGTRRALALEDLSGISEQATVSRRQKATLRSWAFHQLRLFVQYKAQRAGVPVLTVDPRNTSRTCPCCGHVDKRNRPTRSTFSCVACGFSGAADHVAAVNVSRRAAEVMGRPPFVANPTEVNQPNASRLSQTERGTDVARVEAKTGPRRARPGLRPSAATSRVS